MKKLALIVLAFLSAMSVSASAYVQLVETDQLNAGDTVVWVNKANLKGNTTIASSSKYIQVTSVERYGTDTIVATGLSPFVLGGSKGAWTFTYLNGTKVGRVNNETKISTKDNTAFTIKIDTDSNAIVRSAGDSTYQIYYNTSSPRFAFYTSTTMAKMQLFKKLPEGAGPAVKVTDVELDQTELTLREGQSQTLEATVLPADAKNKSVEWGSLNPTIATVTDGVITGIAKGETKIWVRTIDGGFTDTCALTVLTSIDQPNVTWNQLQSLDSIKEGTRVFFASARASEGYILGIYNYDVAKANIPGVEASFSENRHQVTASASYAYTVSIENGKYIFRDLDGSYLCDYNLKNLSAQDNLDNKARWTGSMNEEDYTFTFSNIYNTGYVIYNNHNSDMFCCYNAYDQSNMAPIVLYTDNAPEWVEPVRIPEFTIMVNKDTITDSIPFGYVDYDDSWGTETNPYEASKTITFATKYITDSIYLALKKGAVYTLFTEVVRPTGGTASVQFSTDKKGFYADTLIVRCGERIRKIALTATARDEEEIKPTITLSTKAIDMNININSTMEADAEMTFSVKNLKKNLYIKWEKGEIPERAGESGTILAGTEAAEVNFGSATKMGTSARTNETILIGFEAYTVGEYVSTLCFYTPDELDKNKNAFEQRVTITLTVTDQEPTALDASTLRPTPCTKTINHNQLLIFRDDQWYNVLGNHVF